MFVQFYSECDDDLYDLPAKPSLSYNLKKVESCSLVKDTPKSDIHEGKLPVILVESKEAVLSGSTYGQSPTSDLFALVAQVESVPLVKDIFSKNSDNHKGKVPVDSTAMAKTICAVTSDRSSYLSSCSRSTL